MAKAGMSLQELLQLMEEKYPRGSFLPISETYRISENVHRPFILGDVQKEIMPEPKVKGPTYRVITDTGAEFTIEMEEMSVNWRTNDFLGNSLHLRGRIISPTKQPGFPVPETLRRIEVPEPTNDT